METQFQNFILIHIEIKPFEINANCDKQRFLIFFLEVYSRTLREKFRHQFIWLDTFDRQARRRFIHWISASGQSREWFYVAIHVLIPTEWNNCAQSNRKEEDPFFKKKWSMTINFREEVVHLATEWLQRYRWIAGQKFVLVIQLESY